MHIPDGFLSTRVWASCGVFSFAYLAYAIKHLSNVLKEKLIPQMSVIGAFVFAAQMLNFPVIGGTSGHLLGGAISAIVLGPVAASFIMSVVLIIQCLVFQDGGLTSLGANIFNIAIIGTIGAWAAYKLSMKLTGGGNDTRFSTKTRYYISYAIAAWLSVVLSSLACALELIISGTAVWKIALPAMVGMHAVLGCFEAVATIFVLAGLKKIRPDLMKEK